MAFTFNKSIGKHISDYENFNVFENLEELQEFVKKFPVWIGVEQNNSNYQQKLSLSELIELIAFTIHNTANAEAHSLPPCTEPTVEVVQTDNNFHFIFGIPKCCCCQEKPKLLNIEDCDIEINGMKMLNIEDCDINIS